MTKEDEKGLREKLKKDLTKELSDMIEKEISVQFKNKQTERMVKEISANVLVNLFKTLTNRSSMWAKSL